MTRDQVKSIIEGVTDEQLTAILNLNSGDIGKAKGDTAALQTQLTEAKNTITELEKSKGDTVALQAEIDKYKQADADRTAASEAAQKDALLSDRFGKLHGERKYLNDYTKGGLYGEFKAALEKPENTGKSDADIFTALINDREGIFANPNPNVNIPGAGGKVSSAAANDKMSDEEYYAAYYNNKK